MYLYAFTHACVHSIIANERADSLYEYSQFRFLPLDEVSRIDVQYMIYQSAGVCR